jgi:hypothetical protein
VSAARTDVLVGVTILCHDGWWGALTLGSDLAGRFVDARDRRGYEADARFDTSSGRIELVLHRYDQQLRREFTGYAVGERAFAGTTEWRSRLFGFYVHRGPFPHPHPFGSPTDQVRRDDFFGAYTLWSALGRGTLELTRAPGGIRARYTAPDGSVMRAGARAGAFEDNAIGLQIGSLEADGYLFTRPKNAIAGVARSDGARSGFYMTRFR